MEGKQLELFSDMDFEPKKLHIRKKSLLDSIQHCWFLIDDFERKPTDYVYKENNSYKMAIGLIGKDIYIHTKGDSECNVLPMDRDSKKVTVAEYFILAQTLKNNGSFLYNKKLGKVVLK